MIGSAFRSDAEQAVLFARHPDPKWVARPGTSLHRNGTELDLGPASVYPWLAANAPRFHFVQRYSWESWHPGYVLNPRSAPRTAAARAGAGGADGRRTRQAADFVPNGWRGDQRSRPALERVGGRSFPRSSTPRAASTRSRRPAGAQDGTVHAGRPRNPALRIRSTPKRRSTRGAPSCATCCASSRPSRWHSHVRRPDRRRCRPIIASPSPRRAATSARILGLMGGAGEGVTGGATAGLVVRLIRETATGARKIATTRLDDPARHRFRNPGSFPDQPDEYDGRS